MPTTTAKFLAPTASLGPLVMFPPPSTVRDQSTPSAVRDQGTPSLWWETRAPPLQWGTKVAPSVVGYEGTPRTKVGDQGILLYDGS